MAQVTTVTSESLQAKVRELLPSQQGFGEDLQASNVIIPVIDLTASAGGSDLRQDLQSALAFTDATAIDVVNATATLANSGGFWRIYGYATFISSNPSASNIDFDISNGVSTKQLASYGINLANNAFSVTASLVDFTIYLNSGDSASVTSNGVYSRFAGSVRQIADLNGNLVNPSGFSPQ